MSDEMKKLERLVEAAKARDESVMDADDIIDSLASLDISRDAAAVEYAEACVADEKAVDLFRRAKFDTEEQMNKATTILRAAHEKKYAALAAYRAARGK